MLGCHGAGAVKAAFPTERVTKLSHEHDLAPRIKIQVARKVSRFRESSINSLPMRLGLFSKVKC